jgi:hypothetical protein
MTDHNRRKFLRSLCVAGMVGSAASSLATERQPRPPTDLSANHNRNVVKREFLLFDGLLYKPMPDLRSLGMPKLLSVGNVWRAGASHQEVDPVGMADAIRFIHRYTEHCYFDLEEWTFYGNPVDLEARIRKHLQAAALMRQTAPTLKFGFYGVLPTAPYWPILLNKADELAAWHSVTERSGVVAERVDYLFPSLYTFYDDPKGWETDARAVLKEARRYAKPVYPFLWPRYHNSNEKLKNTMVAAEFWRHQLEVCRDYADGAVLWGGFSELWDEEAPWWLETQSFLSSIGTQSAPKG